MSKFLTFYLKRVAKLKKILDLKLPPSSHAPPTSSSSKEHHENTLQTHTYTHTLKYGRENMRLGFLDRGDG